MQRDHTSSKIDALIHNKTVLFWVLQLLGWLGISLISYISLNLWYNQPELGYLAHNLVQSLLGIVISWPLRHIFRSVWERPLMTRLTVIVTCVLFFSLLWSVARLMAFLLLTDETNLWADFGGWYYPSIFIFFCWTALYHSIKYYQLLQEEHRLRLEILAVQKNESLMRSQAESQAKEALLKMLRYQINPHFLFNTMNSVLALVTAKKNDQAQEMILQLSEFLRYSLSEDIDQLVPLDKELKALEKYLLIEQARFGDRLHTEINVNEEAKTCLIPSFLLQPLLENSIKHAIAPSETGGKIRISAQKNNHVLTMSVDDTGHEANSVKHAESMGVGLKNVQTRLDTLYPNNHGFNYGLSELGGIKVTLEIPADLKQECA